jgi:hypothetical protein
MDLVQGAGVVVLLPVALGALVVFMVAVVEAVSLVARGVRALWSLLTRGLA